MAETNWEKTPELAEKLQTGRKSQRWLFMGAGLALIGVVIFLVINSAGAKYFKTVDELVSDPDLVGKKVRVSGAVVQNAEGVNDVHFDSSTNTLTFQIAHIPNDNDELREQGGLGPVLASAVNNPDLPTITVVYENNEIPDLIYGSEPTQAIVEGELGKDGIFYATSLQTKCPTKYSDDVPDQVADN
ncbi:MAG: cytochrome c maturation protein CcmE [Chloroflexi bacterium]|nr:cytochrome c maturation protein CcmE [Chloroflexota bacterium]